MTNVQWVKRGLVYNVDQRIPWARSHAQIPTAEVMDDDRICILFSSRDEWNRSLITRIEVASHFPSEILNIDATPLMPLGAPGAFDDCGLMPSCIVAREDVRYLYYIGWNVRNTVPYHNSVGLAISEDHGRSYRRLFEGPIMDRTAQEPYFCATTCVRVENGIWRNWYLSCTGWKDIAGRMEPLYHLKYAESRDGINWIRHGRVAIDYENEAEGGIVRACVQKEGCLYRMWYSYRGHTDYRTARGSSYRIGYAESDDGLAWKRRDEDAGIVPSEFGWDSFMIAYPDVVKLTDRYVMFYNGNGFGATGFGYAEAPV